MFQLLWILLVGGVVATVLIGTIWFVGGVFDYFRRQGETGLREIRQSPRRQVEEMTVDEFRQLGLDYLRGHDYKLTTRQRDSGQLGIIATRESEQRLVRFDPAAELENPRAVNQLQVEVKRLELDGVIAVTSAQLESQSRALLERMEATVLDSSELVNWKRSKPVD